MPRSSSRETQSPATSAGSATSRTQPPELPELLEAEAPPRVLILTTYETDDEILSAIEAGASGYLVKSASPAEIRDAVTATGAGDAVFTPGLAGLVLGEFRQMKKEQAATSNAHPVPELTPREVEILRHVATDRSIFARGAVRAAIWGRDKGPGEYDMADVLGL